MQKLQKRNSTRLNTVKSALLVILGTGSLLAPPAQAGRFISLMEAETFTPGLGEVVQVGNWQREKIGESEMSATNIQLGMEFGLGSGFTWAWLYRHSPISEVPITALQSLRARAYGVFIIFPAPPEPALVFQAAWE